LHVYTASGKWYPARPFCRARIYRTSFCKNKPKKLFFNDLKRAFWACFRENWFYKFGHWWWKEIHTAWGGKGYTLHVHTAGGGKRYTLHVLNAGGGKRYILNVHTAGGGKRYTLHVLNAGGGKRYTLHVHTAGDGKGYTTECIFLLEMKQV
jgi:hypothetical protein